VLQRAVRATRCRQGRAGHRPRGDRRTARWRAA
jgi:hypothetical protein